MTKTQIAILWGLALLVVLVFVVLGQIMSRPPRGSTPVAVPTTQVYSLPLIQGSARNLYPGADQAARSWQGDAALASATASWSFALLDDFSRAADWTFQFFSPSTQRIYVVNVSDTQVTPIREALSPYPLPTISMEQWQLDSHQALNAWLSAGGGSFLRLHPIVDVNARLHQSKDGQLEWGIVGAVRESQDIQMTRVNASNGVVLQ